MIINALNSGARVFMADFEDALLADLGERRRRAGGAREAVRGTLAFESPRASRTGSASTWRSSSSGRGAGTWPSRHLAGRRRADVGQPVRRRAVPVPQRRRAPRPGHRRRTSTCRSSSRHLEARLWNDVFVRAQAALGIPRGSVRATVLIETIHAAFEMEEILYELREHSAGLNAGRWDYLFSAIKTFRGRAGPRPARSSQLTMTVPFMRAYTERLVLTCHRRGAHAMGGMAAFIPTRRDAEVNAAAMAKVREDKERESRRRLRRDVGRPPRPRPARDRGLRRGPRRAPTRSSALREGGPVPRDQLLDLRSRAAG